uniref:ARAD1D04400p n=1 Tax=Blastobotrys adeninivorans TaxID=409370 RepID=A0A060T861_BLAAD
MKLSIVLPALVASLSFAQTLPTEDAFYSPPSGFESAPNGQILRSRIPPQSLSFDNLAAAYQLLVKSTNSFGNAIASVTTVLVPNNAQFNKVVSYQAAEDASYIGCAPSYTMQSSADGMAQQLLDQGWVVSVPDHEGINSSFCAGVLGGKITLDSIKAVLASGQLTGVAEDSKVTLWGYSGGSQPSGWAAELQPEYAPELEGKLVGAAVGGYVANITAVAQYVNKKMVSGFLPAGIYGLAMEYPELASLEFKHLVDWKSWYFLKTRKKCMTANLLSFAFQDVWSYFDFGDEILYQPVVQRVMGDQVLGSHAPKIPMYVYQGNSDEVVPYDSVKETVQSYCNLGTKVQFITYDGQSHTEAGATGQDAAVQFLSDRLNGKAWNSSTCQFATPRNATVNLARLSDQPLASVTITGPNPEAPTSSPATRA